MNYYIITSTTKQKDNIINKVVKIEPSEIVCGKSLFLPYIINNEKDDIGIQLNYIKSVEISTCNPQKYPKHIVIESDDVIYNFNKISTVISDDDNIVSKNEIISAANSPFGAYVDIDISWDEIQTPEDFKIMLRLKYGFDIIECKKTPISRARAITSDGIVIFHNGFCTRI